MAFSKFLIGMAFIVIIAIALISYVTNYANDTNANVSLATDTDYSSALTKLKGNASNFKVSVNSSSAGFSQAELEGGTENVQTGGFLKILPTDVYAGTITVLNVAFLKIFGRDTDFGVIFTVITSLLVAFVILYGVKLWLGRSPD